MRAFTTIRSQLVATALTLLMGGAPAQVQMPEAAVRLNEDHRLQTSLWFRCYAQRRPDASELLARGAASSGVGGSRPLLVELPVQQRELLWKEAVEASQRALRFARGEEPAGMQAFRQLGQRQPWRAPPGPIDAETADVAQQTAVRASAQLLALSNHSPRTAQAVSQLLAEILDRSGRHASQEAACLHLVAANLIEPLTPEENQRRLHAILRMRPEVLQVHPMYGRSLPQRSPQLLSCAVGLHLVTDLLDKGRGDEARRLSAQLMSDVRSAIGRVDPRRILPMQLDCGYLMLLAGNLEMAGIGGPANPVLANELFIECQPLIDACGLHSAVLQLADLVVMPSRDAVATSLVRLQGSAYPEVAVRARQLLSDHFTAGERVHAAMGPLQRGFWQFVAIGSAVHAACQADDACRQRAASITSGGFEDEERRREAQKKADDAYQAGMLRAAREDVATRGRGNLVGCSMSAVFCTSRY